MPDSIKKLTRILFTQNGDKRVGRKAGLAGRSFYAKQFEAALRWEQNPIRLSS